MTSYSVALHTLAGALSPWQSLFSNSKVVSGAVTFFHLAGLLFAGGFAVASDRATFRALKGAPNARTVLLTELSDVHRPVLIGLGVLFASGMLLATADVETFGKSPVFLIKMTLVALLGLNGLVLQRTETALRVRRNSLLENVVDEPLWGRLRVTAMTSMGLWTAIVLAGTILVSS